MSEWASIIYLLYGHFVSFGNTNNEIYQGLFINNIYKYNFDFQMKKIAK